MDPQPECDGSWYVTAMERLVGAVQELSHARDLEAVSAIVRDAARGLTGADGATFVLREEGQCYYVEENAIEPLWKGRRFPMETCVSGWVMINAQSAIIEDIYSDPRVLVDAYRPTFVKSLAMVPIRRASPIGAIGNYWSEHRRPSAEEMMILQALADTTSVALENADLYTRQHDMLRRLQEQTAQISDQHASLAVFTRALAHDLREPVRTLISFSELVRNKARNPEKQETYLRFIGEAAERMGVLIDSVGQYTGLDNPDRSGRCTCQLADIVADVRQNLAYVIARKDTSFVIGSLPTIVADPAQMRQLFQNLFANAIIHNAPGVTIEVDCNVVDGVARFTVSDNGAGIPQGKAEEIFQPFSRLVANNESTGLGLSICRRIVGLYSGEIACESAPGEGLVFRFTLPDAVSAQCVVSEEAVARESEPASVLIVDDREADLELTQIALFERSGLRCRVQSASSVEEARERLAAPDEAFDLVLLDINMPLSDGFELLRAMQADETMKSTPVIMCSGSDHSLDRTRSAELGAEGYLLKPPRFADFREILTRLPNLHLVDETKGMTLARAPRPLTSALAD
ncbi:hypothetical protein B2G71_09235 [Novosphingobium sp. PC22D]|uniref:ATP-binding protein n=1 Tax=Novosphingobium sp. PC22D TaxID=1962403 RepID=UPI000BF18CFB|nr:ATP-binding protein [Novosphingobium sp. PC22D]PEQ13004.1 hypothetical protein B2G71_09235 [Novosphingobium sp. PC22D]